MNTVMSDIQTRLSRIKRIEVRPDLSSLTDDENAALQYCLWAARNITSIYRQQMCDHDTFKLGNSLGDAKDDTGKALFEYLCTQGGPWDAMAGNEPFVPGVGPMLPGMAFYPEDMTKKEWGQHIDRHPEDKVVFERNDTLILRTTSGLRAVPYGTYFASPLKEAAQYLEVAAAILQSGSLAAYLRLRSEDLLTGDYWRSDLAWMDMDGTPFEISIGAYETFLDGFLGLKASYQAFIGIKDRESTATLEKYAQHALAYGEFLASTYNFEQRGRVMPMVVVHDVYRGGFMAFGRQFTAQNLPNNRQFHEMHGTRKVFSRLMMDAKPEYILIPIAHEILPQHQAQLCTPKAFHDFLLAHEVSHSVGPTRVRGEGDRVEVRERLRDLHQIIEEAKADMLGVCLLSSFKLKGIVSREELEGSVLMSYMMMFSEFRRSFATGHARANLLEYNMLRKNGAVKYDAELRALSIDIDLTIEVCLEIAKWLMKLQVDGDYEYASDWLKRFTTVPPEIPRFIRRLGDIPLDVHPTFHT